jgi:hypothetical protein
MHKNITPYGFYEIPENIATGISNLQRPIIMVAWGHGGLGSGQAIYLLSLK